MPREKAMSIEDLNTFLRQLPKGSARPLPESTWHEQVKGRLTLGERSADRLRNGMGSWAFVGGFVLFMAVWWILNSSRATAWDPYPFILLNLFLSMLAGLQGAILLIAAKRQDAISAALAQHDFDTNVAARVDIEALLEINRRQLEMIAELQGIARALVPAQTGAGATGADAQDVATEVAAAKDSARAAETQAEARAETQVQAAVRTEAQDEDPDASPGR
ncbi:DUF1003 domain-containing protein [Microbacterium sp. MYb64]|uniref:DUF1003 domain-containing protein n=1 Tax=Microbacterium sp. MYb64 TaxID=1848691 RepID=UPI002689A98A|nr:DUF1003 domain-containing protein [Microbacterium sp. MYb64]